MLLSSLPGVCETFKKVGAMPILKSSGFEIAFCVKFHCLSRDLDWLRCKMSWLPYFNCMIEVSDVLSRCVALHHCRGANGKLIFDCILSAFSVLFELDELALLPTIHARCVGACLHIPPLRSQARRGRWRFLSFEVRLI